MGVKSAHLGSLPDVLSHVSVWKKTSIFWSLIKLTIYVHFSGEPTDWVLNNAIRSSIPGTVDTMVDDLRGI